MPLAPIAVFAYNRPDHLRETLAALSANPGAAESDLYVFSDGPKDAQSEPLVARVRELVRTVPGFRSVTLIERAVNVGLVASVTEGVGRMCAEHGRVIVLEDDLVTSPQFLAFMNGALEKYAGEARVMQISGFMFAARGLDRARALFLPFVTTWGWATWGRAWSAFDPEAPGWEVLEQNRAIRMAFNLDNAYDYYKMLRDHRRGLLASWGVVWNWCVFREKGLVLYPPRSLVVNKGFDGSGTHGVRTGFKAPELSDDVEIEFPSRLAIDETAYNEVKRVIWDAHQGWRHWLKRRFGFNKLSADRVMR